MKRNQRGSRLIAALLSAAAATTANASVFFAFTPDPDRAGAVSPEGCYTEPGLARGLLTGSSDASPCHNGQLGSFNNGLIVGQAPTETVAEFSTGQLSTALSIGGLATLVAYHNVQVSDPTWIGELDLLARLDYALREKHPAGHWTTITSGTAFFMRALGGRGEATFDVPDYTLSPGGRFQVLLFSPDAPGARVFYGGAPLIDDASAGTAMYYSSYSDAGITLSTGDDGDAGGTLDDVVGGGLPISLLLPFLFGWCRRHLLLSTSPARLVAYGALTVSGIALLTFGDAGLRALPSSAMARATNPDGESLPDIGELSIDDAWARALASRWRDPMGLAGSGVSSQIHGGTAASGKKQPAYEGRLYRTGYAGLEPTLGVTSNGWIFYVALDTSGVSGVDSLVIRSQDSGASWEAVTSPRTTQDPYLWVDPATDRIFWTDYVACGSLSYSDDYGETWTDSPPVGCGHNTDHQTVFAGPPVSSTTTGYPNIVYYCSIGAGVGNQQSAETVCSKSLDGGSTFIPTLTPPFPVTVSDTAVFGHPGQCNGASGHVFVGADGNVYVPRGVCGQPWLAISRDEGDTWTQVQVADNGMGREIFSNWDHEAAVRADAVGNIFYTWVARDRIPYLAVSRDRGATWSEPIRVAPPEVNEADLPNMDMDEAGRLAFVYMGSTNSPGAPFPNDGGCEPEHQVENEPDVENCGIAQARAAYAETTWTGFITVTANPLDAAPTFESAPVSTPDDPLIRGECGPFRCQAEYDFLDVEFGPGGEVFAALIDACVPGQCTDIGEAIVGALVEPGKAPRPVATPPRFVADGQSILHFTPDPARATGVASPEGCAMEAGAAIGELAPPGREGTCHSASYGWLQYTADMPAQFTSAPLDVAIVVGGPTGIVAYIADPLRSLANHASVGRFEHQLEAVAPDGSTISLSAGEILQGLTDGRNAGTFDVAPTAVPAGYRLRLQLTYPGGTSSDARLLFGGEAYGDSGIALTLGHFESEKRGADRSADPDERKANTEVAAGALVPESIAWLLLALLWRRRCRTVIRTADGSDYPFVRANSFM
jgi:hypothetical protein